jgi:hypothetical protein
VALLIILLFAVAALLYVIGALPFLYPHNLVHGDVPTVQSIQFKIEDSKGAPVQEMTVKLETSSGLLKQKSDKDGYNYFYDVAWRNVLPIKLDTNCPYEIGPVAPPTTFPSKVTITISCAAE